MSGKKKTKRFIKGKAYGSIWKTTMRGLKAVVISYIYSYVHISRLLLETPIVVMQYIIGGIK